MSGTRCDTCHGEGTIERMATPDEVDNGCELGLSYDPCPDCAGSGRVDLLPEDDALLGVPYVDDVDAQAEMGQGPPAL